VNEDDAVDDGRVLPFTVLQRRRIDRVERAVSGYTDEGGVFIPGLLQNTSDAISLIRRMKTLAYGLFAIGVANALHLYGLADLVKSLFEGK
jgi:hypothetical protein